MIYCANFIFLIIGLILFTIGFVCELVIDRMSDALITIGLFCFLTFDLAFLVNTNWDEQIVIEYEDTCTKLQQARQQVKSENYSEMKANAYLAPYIADSVTWYGRINPEYRK